jgi:hypothetical protein
MTEWHKLIHLKALYDGFHSQNIWYVLGRMLVFCTPAINAFYALDIPSLSSPLSNTGFHLPSLPFARSIRHHLLHHQTRCISLGYPSIVATTSYQSTSINPYAT